MRKLLATALFASASFVAAAPAHAVVFAGCSVNNISPTASACSGFYAGNALSGNLLDRTTQAIALATLGYNGPALTAANWTNIFEPTKISPTSGNKYTFSLPLKGTTYIGIHFGNGAGIFPKGTKGGGTAFYRFDAGKGIPNNLITAALSGGSSAVLYLTGTGGGAVPEPATWAMMILGMGAIGATMRRRAIRTKVSFA